MKRQQFKCSHFANTFCVSCHTMRPLLLCLFILFVSACSSNKADNTQFPIGGYEYPTQVDPKDQLLHFYPIKNLLSRSDSFVFAYYSTHLFQAFNETNLSLTPPERPIFRLVYGPGGTRYTAILLLQENKIIVKELQTGYAEPFANEEKLDSLEKKHYHLLRMYFPINEYQGTGWRKKYFDSITKQYPELLNVAYYKSLKDKANTFGDEKFTYRQREIPLSQTKYNYFVSKLNQSGYWKMKPLIRNCLGQSTHSSNITLEAATQKRYNFVSYMECLEDTSKFAQVYKELISYSKIDINERYWHEQLMK